MKDKIFLDAIAELANKDTEIDVETLRRLILEYGSETPDNLLAAQHITYLEKEDLSGIGTNSGILASDIINRLEESPMPAEIKTYYPQLKEKEWEGILRFCTLLLSALEGKKNR